MSLNRDALKGLIPLYIKGLMSEQEKTEFERELANYPDLKSELDQWADIASVYERVEGKLPEPSPFLYSKIREKVKETRRTGFLQKFLPSARLSLAFISVQFVIIVLLGAYISYQKSTYTTLSAPATSTESAARINIVFTKDARESDIRNLLLQIDSKILDGPSRSGLYVIGVDSSEKAEKALATLRRSGIVVMAEKAY